LRTRSDFAVIPSTLPRKRGPRAVSAQGSDFMRNRGDPRGEWCPGWESNPHEEKSPEDFKLSASRCATLHSVALSSKFFSANHSRCVTLHRVARLYSRKCKGSVKLIGRVFSAKTTPEARSRDAVPAFSSSSRTIRGRFSGPQGKAPARIAKRV